MIPGFPGSPGEPQRPGWLPGRPPPAPVPTPPEQPQRTPSWQRGVFVEERTGPAAALREQLLRRRILLVSGPLDLRLAEETAARAMLADAEGPDPVQLYVNCPEGDLAGAVMLAETLQLMRARVVAVANGLVAGPAVAVYAAAKHRRAHQHAQFRLTEPRASFSGSADELQSAAAVHRDRLDFVHGVIAEATGRTRREIAADLTAGLLLTAPAAADYGLVHQVVSAGSDRPPTS